MFRFDPADHPTDPGVYLFRDAQERVLYVGKARNLRQRLRSYAAGGDGRPTISAMLRRAARLECLVTDSEVEALVLENNLIKEHRPRYNIFLKDDKTYPYIRVTRELFPRILVTRRLLRDGSRYFGPYTEVKHLRGLLRSLRAALKIRACELAISEASIAAGRHKVCLDFHLGTCLGPCEGRQGAAEYGQAVEAASRILRGRVDDVARDTREQMAMASRELRFEEAARLRDHLRALEQLRRGQKMEKGASDEDLDVVAMARSDTDACAVLLQIREGRLLGRFHGFLKGALEGDPAPLLRAFLGQYYARCEHLPGRVLLPAEHRDADLLADWLSQRRREQAAAAGESRLPGRVRLAWPSRGEKRELLRLAEANARRLLEGLQLERMKRERVPATLKALARDLQLNGPPRRIEGFDVSHFGGESTVASLVVFVDGRPLKRDYRRFRIRTVAGGDDFAAMEEAVRRRYTRRLAEQAELPDLVLIDGGKGQLGRAAAVLSGLGLGALPVVGLAKRLEEVFVPRESLPRNIPKASASNRLLQHVRDEAHRFALGYNRELRAKADLPEPLAGVPGLGPILRRRLFERFGTLRRLAEAGEAELREVPGIGPALAAALRAALQEGEGAAGS
jgi:excinuclease ABC subunit C